MIDIGMKNEPNAEYMTWKLEMKKLKLNAHIIKSISFTYPLSLLYSQSRFDEWLFWSDLISMKIQKTYIYLNYKAFYKGFKYHSNCGHVIARARIQTMKIIPIASRFERRFFEYVSGRVTAKYLFKKRSKIVSIHNFTKLQIESRLISYYQNSTWVVGSIVLLRSVENHDKW